MKRELIEYPNGNTTANGATISKPGRHLAGDCSSYPAAWRYFCAQAATHRTRLVMLQTGMRAPMGIKVKVPAQTIQDFGPANRKKNTSKVDG